MTTLPAPRSAGGEYLGSSPSGREQTTGAPGTTASSRVMISRTNAVASRLTLSAGSSVLQKRTTLPSGFTRNFQKFHLGVPDLAVGPRFGSVRYQPVRNLKAGSASEPIILILPKNGKVTPWTDLANASMSRLVPSSVSPNWPHGKASTLNWLCRRNRQPTPTVMLSRTVNVFAFGLEDLLG
ncbi:hypothetical protein EYF80_023253 [Liparis tanakae]|uniref:Uncharacterized protein n=1 Tax=Liparis tanakae TaxID=230148 RepID=A0A4Z2HLE7_9TELE|nr:hypothetical protein EYF80_023253 [Liparis tanakae]